MLKAKNVGVLVGTDFFQDVVVVEGKKATLIKSQVLISTDGV